MATIKDIAKAAGVAPSTVSRALSDRSRISQETKDRISLLAKEMGYTPSWRPVAWRRGTQRRSAW